MTHDSAAEIHKKLLEAHRRGVEEAIDLSIRTGVPLVVQNEDKIEYIYPEYKYVRVPIEDSHNTTHPKL